MDKKNIVFEEIKEEDIYELTNIMTKAFNHDSFIHLGVCKEYGPPGYDDGTFLRKWALHNDSTSYKLMYNNECIGGIILWITKENVNKLGCIFLNPEMQGKNIGTYVWGKVESMFPDTTIWKTETAGYSIANHHFYVNKCRFKIIGIEEPFSQLERQYIMEKVMI